MKRYLRLFSVLLLVLTVLLLSACGGDKCATGHTDLDGDSLCDVCAAELPPEENVISLINNGKASFQFVSAVSISSDVKRTIEQDIVRALKQKYDVTVGSVTENSKGDTEREYEVLVGGVTSRGQEYIYDNRSLGKGGYMIKLVGTKIIITGGSDAALVTVLNIFADNILGMSGEEITSASMAESQSVYSPDNSYVITSLSVAGQDMRGYTIATDGSGSYYSAATLLQDRIYEHTGYWFEIVAASKATDKSIVIGSIDKVSGDDSFRIYTSGTQLIIECAYDNMLDRAMSQFITKYFIHGSGDIDFSGKVHNQDISVVCYEDFGAKGDGVTNDFAAIYYTHEFANTGGQTVRATPGASYYIGSTKFALEGEKDERVQTVRIRTNVNWSGAKFIIDDTLLTLTSGSAYRDLCDSSIFEVLPDSDLTAIKIDDEELLSSLVAAGLNPDTEYIDIDIGYSGSLMIIPYNYSHNIYRRRAYSDYLGEPMHEVIIIDGDGRVSEQTPIIYNYTSLDYIEIYRIDESRAVTIEGGEFTTVVCQENPVYTNSSGSVTTRSTTIARNISIKRPYTTIRGVKHYTSGEVPLTAQLDEDGKIVKCGAAYAGFFSVSDAVGVSFESCIFTAKRSYSRPQGGNIDSYDFYAESTASLSFKECKQSNFWVTLDGYSINPADKNTPGALLASSSVAVNNVYLRLYSDIGAAVHCKNMSYTDSTLSAYNVSRGLWGGSITRSTVNGINVSGGGKLTVSDSTLYTVGDSYKDNSLIRLSEEYGSSFDGEISVNDTDAYVYTSGDNFTGVFLLHHTYENWYYGQTSHFPSLSVDSLTLYNIGTKKPLDEYFEIYLTGEDITRDSALHLDESDKNAYYAVEDKDGDGYVDEPHYDRNLDGKTDESDLSDLDGDGNPGNLSILYADVYRSSGYLKGVSDGTFVNINVVIPPEYIKVINNSGGYIYVITNTALNGVSEGNHYDGIDSSGGFFGDTKIIYGEGDGDFLSGVNYPVQTSTHTFQFR